MNWNECFTYMPETGDLVWKERPLSHFTTDRERRICNTRYAGKLATSRRATTKSGKKQGVVVGVSGKKYYAHRVIWEMFNGSIPDGMVVDHEDVDPWNNKLGNLRLASHSQNLCNARAKRNNKCGIKGVCWLNRERKWIAQIQVNKRRIKVGYFDTKGMAAVAYAKAALMYHGQFARFA